MPKTKGSFTKGQPKAKIAGKKGGKKSPKKSGR